MIFAFLFKIRAEVHLFIAALYSLGIVGLIFLHEEVSPYVLSLRIYWFYI